MKKIFLFTSCALGGLTAFPAQAQQAQPVAAVSADAGIAEIVVTAQRKEESAQKAAIAIDVVSAAELANAGVVTSTTLNTAVPSLYVAKGGGANTSYFIRGVGNFTNNGFSDPAVAFNLDGVYLGRPTSTTGTFYDLERIEVLKGPQGTLYGRNATGGAINILPSKPKLGQFSGYGAVGYGRFNAFDAEAAINAPLGKSVAIRLSGKYVDSEGFNRDGTGDEKGEAFRAQIYAEPSPDFNIRLAGDYSRNRGIGPGASFDGTVAFSPGAAASATAPANYVFRPAPATLGPREGLLTDAARAYQSTFVIGGAFISPAALARPYLNNTAWGIMAEANLQSPIGTFTVIPAYRKAKVDNLFNGPAFRAGLVAEDDEQYSVEARLVGKAIGPVDWLVGGYWFNEKVIGQNAFNQYVVTAFQSFTSKTESLAAFGRLTFNLSDRVRLVGGARYTSDRKNFQGGGITLVDTCTRAAPPAGPGCFGGPSLPVALTYADLARVIPAADIPAGLPTLPGPANARPYGAFGNILFFGPVNISQPINNGQFTYRLAAEFDLGPSSLLYASYETGYRSGGYSVSAGRESYGPEFLSAATVGLKSRFFNNRVQLNIEAFYWKYRDQQVSHFGLDALGGNSFFTENIGRSTIKGIDIDFQFKPARQTLLRGSVQYLDNQLDSFVYNTARTATSLPPVVGCAYAPGVDSIGRNVYIVDCSGKSGYNSPKWAINAGIEQGIDLGDYLITLNLDGRYRSNRVTGFEYLAQQNSGSDFTADASVTFGAENERWGITAWVRNLTDRTVPVFTQFAGSTGNNVSTVYQPPRSYGVRARLNF